MFAKLAIITTLVFSSVAWRPRHGPERDSFILANQVRQWGRLARLLDLQRLHGMIYGSYYTDRPTRRSRVTSVLSRNSSPITAASSLPAYSTFSTRRWRRSV